MNRNNNNYGNRNKEAGVELRILLPSKVNLKFIHWIYHYLDCFLFLFFGFLKWIY